MGSVESPLQDIISTLQIRQLKPRQKTLVEYYYCFIKYSCVQLRHSKMKLRFKRESSASNKKRRFWSTTASSNIHVFSFIIVK